MSIFQPAKAMGNLNKGDGYKYRGRGLVQLTWRNNYQLAQNYFQIDFVNNPNKAANYKYSIPIMIWGMKQGIFTKKKLSNYINAKKVDYEDARKVINGSNDKKLIANYAKKFELILRKTSFSTQDF